VATNLKWIGEKARKEPDLVFTSLYHHIMDVDNLRACYDSLEAGKATGVDGVSKQQYGRDLESNLRHLSEQLGRMSYRPGAKRRSYIPKAGSAQGRPLGISNFEDKIVEAAVKRTLEPIYESVFEDSSYGYRPGRSQHQCLDALGHTIQHKRINHVVEADIKSFFDKVNHQWLEDRLEGFGLKVAEDKTRSIEFGRFARESARKRGEKPEEFTFLGFTHYCGKTRRGYFKLKRRTSRKKLAAGLREFTDWAIRARCVMRKGEMLRIAQRRVIGHLNYYAITDNSERCSYYVYRTTRILFKWLNRKSQRRAYTWAGFNQALIWAKWPKPSIRKDLDPCRRAEAY
jgi:hypothetical protein